MNRMGRSVLSASLSAALLLASPDLPKAAAQSTQPIATPAESLPVREVTVFKDGHAFVLHEGEARVASGEARLDGLPEAVIGTFWPYAATDGVRLVSTTAARASVALRRPARNIAELLRANVGAEAVIQEVEGPAYPATILDVPVLWDAAAASVVSSSPPGGLRESSGGLHEPSGRSRELPGETRELSATSRFVVLRTFEGDKVVSIERIRDVTYKRPVATQYTTAEQRGELRLRLERDGHPASGSVKIGLVYLQRGMRWIPNYRVDLDGKGTATVRLQATLLNELRDVENVRVNLVIGVPTFKFKHTLDPSALQATATQLSQYFQEGLGQTAYAFSNAIMAQQVRMSDYASGQPPAPLSASDDIAEASRAEDLFVFTVENVTLRRGEATTLPVTEFKIPYEDVFALDMPFKPPTELECNVRGPEQEEMLRLMRSPKVTHRVRLKNTSGGPLTTAPALLLREGRVLAQGLMTYASAGGSCDLDVTTALDVRATRKERETERRPKALVWNGLEYFQVVLDGKIRLTNYRATAVEVEVTRRVLGRIEAASDGGTTEQSNVLEGDDAFESGRPHWWHWYNWPSWWSVLNGAGSVTWKVKLEPGKSVELTYRSSYYWR